MIFSTKIDILTLAIIAGINISQSLFGVGILLWVTSIFLLLGEKIDLSTFIFLDELSLRFSSTDTGGIKRKG